MGEISLIVRRLFAVLGGLAALFVQTAPGSAHPLGNFTINHLAKVRLANHRVLIHYILDIAEIPTFQIMRENDAAGNTMSRRLDDWAQRERATVLQGLRVESGGVALVLQPQVAHVATRPGAGGLPTIYWTDELSAQLPEASNSLSVSDRTYENRIGWKDIVVAPAREPTDELRHYPNALLASPRDTRALALTLSAQGVFVRTVATPPRQTTAAPLASQIRSNKLSDMLARGSGNPLWVLLTLVIAIGLGALHALEPGHGKTLLAVSLVGARATTAQALLLASALTFSHTAGVLALGVAMVFAAKWIVPESVYPWITLLSGALVAFMGANALARFVRLRRGLQHGHDGHEHSHGHEHGHAHAHDRSIAHGEALSFRSIILIAMSGNIAPCPAALVVLLTALTLRQVGYGLAVIVAFSVGLAAVLTVLGIAFVRGAHWLSDRPELEKFVRVGPILSACVIAIIGAVMVGQGLASGSLHAPAWMATVLTIVAIAGYAGSPAHGHAHGPHPVRG